MANKTLFSLMFLCSYALVFCILGLESVALVALWLKNPFNQRNLRLMKHLHAYKAPSTSVEDSLQIDSFMQNKANFRKSQMNVTDLLTKEYEKKDTWWSGKNKPKTNPKRTQFKANQTQFHLP